MDTISELSRAREGLAKLLDPRLRDVPEWRAIRAIDRALIELAVHVPTVDTMIATGDLRASRTRSHPTYIELTNKLLDQKGRPVTTPELLTFVRENRPTVPDDEKAKINITSSLSKDDRFVSIAWGGGRAWWHAHQAVPPQNEDQMGLGVPEPN